MGIMEDLARIRNAVELDRTSPPERGAVELDGIRVEFGVHVCLFCERLANVYIDKRDGKPIEWRCPHCRVRVPFEGGTWHMIGVVQGSETGATFPETGATHSVWTVIS